MRRAGRPITMAAVSVFLSGCALVEQPHVDQMAGAVQTCLAQNKLFTDAWGCVQGLNVLDKLSDDTARKAQFIRLGDDLAAQVAAKKVSDADARKRLLAGVSDGGSTP